jgi:hypothetical protein
MAPEYGTVQAATLVGLLLRFTIGGYRGPMRNYKLILAVAAVGVVAAVLFAWRMSAEDVDTTQPAAAQQTPASPFAPSSTHVASSEPVAAPTPAAPAATAAVEPTPEAPVVAAPAPVDVDTPEPAERKFAHGGRSEPEQN